VNVRVLAPALQEITDAAIWFDKRRVGLGDQFWLAVEAVLERIQSKPAEFAKSEFATTDADIRFAIVHRFNYIIHFLVEHDEAQIISVAHAARRPGYWLSRTKR
jgi:toxin ParE1/3/4